jgi:hypothetical protein
MTCSHCDALAPTRCSLILGLPIIAITEIPRKAVTELAKEFGAAEILHQPVTPAWRPVVERVRAMADRS